MLGLGEVELESLATAIEEVLQKRGLDLASTPWLTALGRGLYEFRVRHDAATIRALYIQSGMRPPARPAKILLRLLCTSMAAGDPATAWLRQGEG